MEGGTRKGFLGGDRKQPDGEGGPSACHTEKGGGRRAEFVIRGKEEKARTGPQKRGEKVPGT